MNLTPFVDPLPIPQIMKPKARFSSFSYYEITMDEFEQQLHSELPKPTRVWGYAGMYIIRDDEERSLNLPSGRYEIPLVIQDRSFNEDGSLFYPRNVDNPGPDYPDPSVTPGVAGDKILVNGMVWPYLEVEQRKYRFRILNGSNERFYRMRLSNGSPFIQIGSDGGLLEKPVIMNEIIIAPAERVDVIINFADVEVGTNIVLTNDAENPYYILK